MTHRWRTWIKRRGMRIAMTFAIYVLAALWSTWPLADRALSALPSGAFQVETVPLFNLWTIWWNSDRVLHGFQNYWQAPIFHPTPNTFAFSEPQPMTLIVAPVIWLTGSRVLAYNLYVWLSLILNGIFAECLLRSVGVCRRLAVVGGVAMILLPLVHAQLDVMQLAPVWGILWTWRACWRTSQHPSVRNGLEVGIGFAATFHACGHQGLFLALLLGSSVWVLPRHWLAKKTWLAWGTAGLSAAILIAPIVLPMRAALNHQEFVRTPELVAQLSAQPGDYTAVTGRPLLNLGEMAARPIAHFSPGWLKTVLALAGIGMGLSRRRWRHWTVFLTANLIIAFLLSLGPNLNLWGWQPWWSLVQVVPGLDHVRNVFRFAFFVQMILVLFATAGLHWGYLLCRRCQTGNLKKCIRVGLALLAFAAVFETIPQPMQFIPVPDPVANYRWVEFIRHQTPPGRAVACIPFPDGNAVGDYQFAARWMFFGTYHQVPMVNGYSGFFPDEYFRIQDAVQVGVLTPNCMSRLQNAGVEFLIVHQGMISPQQLQQLQSDRTYLQSVFVDPVGIEIFRLRR